MNEILTLEEIHERFPSEWVLLANPETDANLTVKPGELIWHSKDRDELYRKAIESRLRHSAVLYTGPILAEGTEVLL